MIKAEQGQRDGPSCNVTSVLLRRDQDTDMHPGVTTGGHGEDTASYGGREASEGTNTANSLMSGF